MEKYIPRDKSLKEMIAIMQAYAGGKKVECINREYPEVGWMPVEVDGFNWHNYDYRVKEMMRGYRPYKNAEEFLNAQKKHGYYITSKKNDIYDIPNRVTDEEISFVKCYEVGKENTVTDFLTYEELLYDEEFIWQDGTPCGVSIDDGSRNS